MYFINAQWWQNDKKMLRKQDPSLLSMSLPTSHSTFPQKRRQKETNSHFLGFDQKEKRGKKRKENLKTSLTIEMNL